MKPLYSEYLTKETLEGYRYVKIGQVIRTVKYANDLVLLAKEETLPEGTIDRLNKLEDAMEWKWKWKSENLKATVLNTHYDRSKPAVECGIFKQSGQHNKNRCKMYTWNYIHHSNGKSRIQQKEALFTSKLGLNLRMKLVQCYIRSTAVYGAEYWKLRKEEKKYLESFEIWCWRRMEKRNEV